MYGKSPPLPPIQKNKKTYKKHITIEYRYEQQVCT